MSQNLSELRKMKYFLQAELIETNIIIAENIKNQEKIEKLIEEIRGEMVKSKEKYKIHKSHLIKALIIKDECEEATKQSKETKFRITERIKAIEALENLNK